MLLADVRGSFGEAYLRNPELKMDDCFHQFLDFILFFPTFSPERGVQKPRVKVSSET